MPQARMTMESDAIVELESRFTAEDTRLFRMAAERTLPELPTDAADATDDARSGHLIASPCISQLWGYEGDSHDNTRCSSYLQSARLDAVGPVDCGGLPWLPAAPSSAQPGTLSTRTVVLQACMLRHSLLPAASVSDASSICAVRCTMPTVQALPKPPTEAEMQELLRAMDLDVSAPGSANAERSHDMRFTFHLTVSTVNVPAAADVKACRTTGQKLPMKLC